MEILHTTIYQPGRSTYHMEANDFLLILEGEGIAQCGNDNVYPVAKGVAFSTIEKTELKFEASKTLVLGCVNLGIIQVHGWKFRYFSPDETELFHQTFLYGLTMQAAKFDHKDQILDYIVSILYICLFQGNPVQTDTPQYIFELLSDAHRNLSNVDYNISEEIKKLNYSADYTRRLIFKETGKTPVQFLTNMRIEYAQILIRENKGNISVKKLAFSCGFKDEFYFSRQFKKYTGESPKTYIKKRFA